MLTSVIIRLTCAIMKFSIIVKIRKYRRLHEGHHFISMVMKMHGVFGCDLYCFIKECVHLFHNRQLVDHLSLSFCINFFKQHVNIVFPACIRFCYKKEN